MDGRRAYWWAGLAGLLVLAEACGSDDIESRAPSVSDSSYCGDLDEISQLLDGGGTVDEYNVLMSRIVDESPADHAPTWSLMMVLSAEPFSYDNFNPATDALDRLYPDLVLTCPELRLIIVDDSGRIRSLPTE